MDIPTLAILYENSPGITQIKTYYIILKEKKIIDAPWSPQNVDSSAKAQKNNIDSVKSMTKDQIDSEAAAKKDSIKGKDTTATKAAAKHKK